MSNMERHQLFIRTILMLNLPPEVMTNILSRAVQLYPSLQELLTAKLLDHCLTANKEE